MPDWTVGSCWPHTRQAKQPRNSRAKLKLIIKLPATTIWNATTADDTKVPAQLHLPNKRNIKTKQAPHNAVASAAMRPTQALFVGKYRHLKLTTKDVGRGFYKGNRTGSMGRHTKYGGFVIEWNKVRTYTVPQSLKDFKVREREGWRNREKEGQALSRLEYARSSR